MASRTIRTGAAVLVVAVALVGVTGTAVAHGGDDGLHHHDGWMGTHDGGGWLGTGGLFGWALLLIGLSVLVRYAVVAGLGRGDTDDSNDALSVLRERYARGEIDDEEFETRRQRLQ
jgi:putative membrane protein